MSGIERVLVVGGGPAGTTAAIALAGRGLTPEIVELDPDWTALGVGLLLQGPPLRALRSIGLLARFMERRYDRCRLVVENSILLGEWEQHPGTPGADPGRVVAETFSIVARPL